MSYKILMTMCAWYTCRYRYLWVYMAHKFSRKSWKLTKCFHVFLRSIHDRSFDYNTKNIHTQLLLLNITDEIRDQDVEHRWFIYYTNFFTCYLITVSYFSCVRNVRDTCLENRKQANVHVYINDLFWCTFHENYESQNVIAK